MNVLQCVHQQGLPVRKQMGVDIHGGRDVFVSHPGSYSHCGKAVVDQQRYVGVADVMGAYLTDAGGFAAHPQLEEQVVERTLEQPPVGADVVFPEELGPASMTTRASRWQTISAI